MGAIITNEMNMKSHKVAFFILRAGVAFTFLYASISAVISPISWLSYFPDFMRYSFTDQFLLQLWGGTELVIGLWILSGWKIFVPSVFAAILLSGIFFFDYERMSIIFRNVSILATSIGLAIYSFPHSFPNSQNEDLGNKKTASSLEETVLPHTPQL